MTKDMKDLKKILDMYKEAFPNNPAFSKKKGDAKNTVSESAQEEAKHQT